jgi:hypothetical protein
MPDTSGFGTTSESLDARVLLFSTGFILESLTEGYGTQIDPLEIRQRTKTAAAIITKQIGHDGCMAMDGYEVQDLLCRLSGLFQELVIPLRRLKADNAASLCNILQNHLRPFCGRGGGGDRRSLKTQSPQVKARAPSSGRTR